jgi:hypothetical protein
MKPIFIVFGRWLGEDGKIFAICESRESAEQIKRRALESNAGYWKIMRPECVDIVETTVPFRIEERL